MIEEEILGSKTLQAALGLVTIAAMHPQNAMLETSPELCSARPRTGEPNATFGCTEASNPAWPFFSVHSINASVGPSPDEATTATWRYQSNQQFSITAVTTSSGSVAERYAYTAYGQPTILDSSGSILASSSLGNRYTYTGREWDQTLSLYHFRARWMSGLAGRFMGRDPIGYSSGLLTIYAFIDANTLANLDPHGLMSVMLPLPNPMFNPDIMPFGSATGGCVDTVTSIQRVAKCRVPGFVYGTRIVSVACDSGLYASCCSSVPGVISSSGVIVTKGTRTCNAGEEQNALAPGGAVITALSKCPARPSINLNPLVIAWAMSQKDVETQEMSLEYEDLPLTEKVNKAYDCKKATKHQLNLAGIFHEHSFKDEWGGQPNSRFEICACKDGSIVLARTGQCGSPGEKIETDAVWK